MNIGLFCRGIMSRPMCQDTTTTLHFVDDRADTLLHLAQQPHLQRWQLYFAEWCATLLNI